MKTKKQKPTFEVITPDYNERSGAMQAMAADAELVKMSKVYKQFDAAAKNIKSNTIAAANLARELGLHLQALSGHEQIDFAFWKNHCEGKTDFDFNAAKKLVSIARKMPQPAKTLQEAVSFIQEVLVADGVLLLPQRTEVQCRSAASLLQVFCAQVTIVYKPFKKMIDQRPMTTWTPEECDTFLTETEWVHLAREDAMKIKAK